MTDPKKSRRLVATDPNLTEAERAAILAVEEFRMAEKAIELFTDTYPQLMKEYRELLEERNQKLSAADTAIRGLDVSYGPWDRFTADVRYDADALYENIGRTKFLEIGGQIGMEETHKIDGARIELAISKGQIPATLVPVVKKIIPKYRTPKAKT